MWGHPAQRDGGVVAFSPLPKSPQPFTHKPYSRFVSLLQKIRFHPYSIAPFRKALGIKKPGRSQPSVCVCMSEDTRNKGGHYSIQQLKAS